MVWVQFILFFNIFFMYLSAESISLFVKITFHVIYQAFVSLDENTFIYFTWCSLGVNSSVIQALWLMLCIQKSLLVILCYIRRSKHVYRREKYCDENPNCIFQKPDSWYPKSKRNNYSDILFSLFVVNT